MLASSGAPQLPQALPAGEDPGAAGISGVAAGLVIGRPRGAVKMAGRVPSRQRDTLPDPP
jgi:hypothetical protein